MFHWVENWIMRSLIYIEQSNTAKNTIELISKLLLHIVWAEYTEKGVIEYTVYILFSLLSLHLSSPRGETLR